MLIVGANYSGVLEGLHNTSVMYALDKSLSNRGVGQTHIWYILAIDCYAPAFLTLDEI